MEYYNLNQCWIIVW